MQTLKDSVGKKGRNLHGDVEAVQKALNLAGFTVGRADGICGPKTISGITRCQQSVRAAPTGLLDPKSSVWQNVSRVAEAKAAELEREWGGDSSLWPQEKKLLSMAPALRLKVRLVIASLKQEGFRPKIVYGWRSVKVQARLVEEGKSKVRFSFHNAQLPDGTPNSYAADIIDERWGWNEDAMKEGFWKALGKTARVNGLVWGGAWTSFPDWAHVQSRQNSELSAVKLEIAL